jgi:hypothetical protein
MKRPSTVPEQIWDALDEEQQELLTNNQKLNKAMEKPMSAWTIGECFSFLKLVLRK